MTTVVRCRWQALAGPLSSLSGRPASQPVKRAKGPVRRAKRPVNPLVSDLTIHSPTLPTRLPIHSINRSTRSSARVCSHSICGRCPCRYDIVAWHSKAKAVDAHSVSAHRRWRASGVVPSRHQPRSPQPPGGPAYRLRVLRGFRPAATTRRASGRISRSPTPG